MYSVLILHMNLLPAMAMVTALEVLTGSVTFAAPTKGPGCPFLRPALTWHSHGTCWQGAASPLLRNCTQTSTLGPFLSYVAALTPLILLHCAGSTPDLPCHHGLVWQSLNWWLNWVVTRLDSETVGVCPFSKTMAPAACFFCFLTTAA